MCDLDKPYTLRRVDEIGKHRALKTPGGNSLTGSSPVPGTYKADLVVNCCIECGYKIDKCAKRCKSCVAKKQPTKIDWPSTNELIEMVKNLGFVAVGRELGISDNAIRKRVRNHN